jgi:amidophosphoribosyltransferase
MHTAVKKIEGREDFDTKEYADTHNSKHQLMVEQIRKRLDFTILMYQKLEDLVQAIGLPQEKLCTHCWDGSSYY